jgi:hypothetical protein
MKAINILGVIIGIFGMVLTLMNVQLEYAEGPPGIGGIYKHDNVGNVFRLLSFLFFALTAICVFNLYWIRGRRFSK